MAHAGVVPVRRQHAPHRHRAATRVPPNGALRPHVPPATGMSKVAELFESLDYGPAPESPTPVLEWLGRHPRPFDLFIGGRWVKATSGASFETVNPATGQPIARVAQAGPQDVDAAVRAARQGFGSWSRLSGHARAPNLHAL